MFLMCNTHNTLVTWKVYNIHLSGNIVLLTKWHCFVALLCLQYSPLRIKSAFDQHTINKTTQGRKVFKKKGKFFSLQHQPVFSGEMWLSVFIMFSVGHSFVSQMQLSCPPSSRQLPSGFHPFSFPLPLLHTAQNLQHSCPGNWPRCQQPHPVEQVQLQVCTMF